MNKKAFFVLVTAMIVAYIIYRVIINVINDAVDDANKRGVEEYVEAIRLEYAGSLLTGETITNIDDIDINITTKVECEEKSISLDGIIELHGCRVEDSKRKYSYVNDKVGRE